MRGGQGTIGVGVIGATGYIGAPYRTEIRAAPGARLAALCARRRDLLAAAARVDAVELATTDWREVISHPAVDLVVVATPDALHRDAAMACAGAGRHLFCEKPVGANAAEAREVRDAFRAKPELFHFVPFWSRYLGMFERARDILRGGALGTVRSVICRWFNPRPPVMPFTWRDDPSLSAGGSIADIGSHAYDTVRWLLQRDAVRVFAHARTLAGAKPDLGAINLGEALEWSGTARTGAASYRVAGTPDYAALTWEYDDGATGLLVVSHAPHLRRGLAPELELHGTGGSLAVDRASGRVTLARGKRPPEVVAMQPEALEDRFARWVLPALRRTLAGRESDHPDLESGYRVQLFTDAAALSSGDGGWRDVVPVGGAGQCGSS